MSIFKKNEERNESGASGKFGGGGRIQVECMSRRMAYAVAGLTYLVRNYRSTCSACSVKGDRGCTFHKNGTVLHP